MAIKTHITDPSTGRKASVVDSAEENALVVATRPLKTFSNTAQIFTDADGNPDMAIGVEFGANPEGVFNGEDTTQWTASTPVGGNFTEDSTDHAKNGNITFANNTIDDLTITFTLSTGALGAITEGVDWNKGGNTGASADALAVYLNASIAAITAISDTVDSVMVYATSTTTDLETIALGGAGAANTSQTAQCVDAVDAKENDVFQMTRPGGDLDLATYVSITGYIYVTKWKNEGIEMLGWDDGESMIVGNVVNINDYIDNTLNEWQKFTILLSDMGLSDITSGFDAIRISPQHKDSKFFFDYLEIQEGGTVDPTIYTIEPDKGTWLHVHSFMWSIADELDTTLENNSMPNLSYNKILGVSELATGISYQRIQNEVIQSSANIKSLTDILQWPGTEIKSLMRDETNAYLTIETVFTEPIVLKSEHNDQLRLVINDSTAGLLLLRATCGCRTETRPLT